MITENYEIRIKKIIEKWVKRKSSYADYLIEKYKNYQDICVFGTGNMGSSLPKELMKYGIVVKYFCDNNPQKEGTIIEGIPCISLRELEKRKDKTMVIIATRYYKEIYNQLKQLGFIYIDRVFDNKFMIDEYLKNIDHEVLIKKIEMVLKSLEDEKSCYIFMRIIEEWCKNEYFYGQLDDIYSEPQYFDSHIIQLIPEEVFVDCGAYDGDTFREYMKYCKNMFSEAYLFELSNRNFKKLEVNIKNDYPILEKNIKLINCGVSGQDGTIEYCDDDEGSSIKVNGHTIGNVVTLDNYFKNQMVTFIKMDIEGAELEALVGSVELIRRCKPKVAVCLYHKPEDLLEIPLFMIENFVGYRFFIRHHTDLMNETVLYAIPK